MANITINGINITEAQIQQLLTTRDKEQELISLLSMLFTNMNNLDRLYYDMFINSTPMDLILERYDEQGVLQTYIVPNRAKDKGDVILGLGDPEGVAVADIGRMYLNTITGEIFYKREGNDAFGWIEIRTKYNMVDDSYPISVGKDIYLRPNGNGSNLQNLNATNITGGVLSVNCGGTGQGWGSTDNSPFEDNKLLKYDNNELKIVSAIEDVDYIVPGSMVGQIAFFLMDEAPEGWLHADGSTVSQSLYTRLYDKIGDKFNDGTEPAGDFRLPDLRGYFLRGWDNGRNLDSNRLNMSYQNPAVPQHNHNFTNGIAAEAGSHTHQYTDPVYTYEKIVHQTDDQFRTYSYSTSTSNTGSAGAHTHTVTGSITNASNPQGKTIYDATVTEVRPYNFAVLACIKF